MTSNRAAASAVFVLFSALYIATMCPGCYTMDAGELIIAAYKLGIAHATGYPLFCLLGKLFTWLIPFGSIAWRVNAMNALFAAGAVSLLFLALSEAVKSRRAALLAAALFGVSPIYWEAAAGAEVHALSALLTTLELFLFFRWKNSGEDRLLPLIALAAGLGATNHMLSLLVVPGILLAIFCHDPRKLRDYRLLAPCVLLFLLPLSLYLYLPVRAQAARGTIWGDIYASMGFKSHVTGKMFKTLMFRNTPLEVGEHFLYFLKLMLEQFWIFILLLVPGIKALRRQGRGLLGLLAIITLINVGYSINYDIIDIETYYLPTMIAVSVILAMGAHEVLKKRTDKSGRSAALGVLCVLLLAGVLYRLPQLDKRDSGYIGAHARNVLKTLKPNALFISCGDASHNALLYCQSVQGKRPDVLVIQRQILKGWPKGMVWPARCYYQSICRLDPDFESLYLNKRFTREDIRKEKLLYDMIEAVIDKRPVYFVCWSANHRTHPIVKLLEEHYRVLPEGITYRLYPRSAKVDLTALALHNENLWRSYELDGIYRDRSGVSEIEREVPNRYASSHMALGDVELQIGMYSKAEINFRKSLEINSGFLRARNGLGVALACQGDYKGAARQWSAVLAKDPKNETALRNIKLTKGPSNRD